jgi:hypothetical protein
MSIKSEVCMFWMEGHLQHCLDLMIYVVVVEVMVMGMIVKMVMAIECQ